MAFLELSKNDTTSNCIFQAIEEADLIPRDSVKSEAFMEIALHFFRTDNIQSGLDLIEKTPSFYWKSYVLCELIRLEKEINQEEIIYQSKSNKKTKSLIDKYVDGSKDRFAIKAAYIIRDTVKVIGTNSGIPPINFAFFYDDFDNPKTGGTGHTMTVCEMNNIPYLTQEIWSKWI